MLGRSRTMSPVSTDGSEWSGINQYQSMGGKSDPPMSPGLPGRSALASPPMSTSGPPYSPLEMNAPGSSGPNGLAPRRPGEMLGQNPSPPSSVTSRSRASDGTLSDQKSKRYRMMEDMLLKHYGVLKRFLQGQGNQDPAASRSSRARDKLVRLSPGQVMELSTDVYDELLRRQAASPNRPGGPRADVPPYLLPRQEFHEKRNQARQKLSSLLQQRFKDLATDVLCELERRFPHFSGMDLSRRASPAPSVRGGYGSGPGPGPNGYGPPRPDSNGQYGYGPNGYPPPPRTQSRGPTPGGPGPRGFPPGPAAGRFPPRNGSLSQSQGLGINGETIPENAPFPKSSQSNTIVPNKSTLVEDDDDDEAGYDEDDDDRRSDAFALDKVLQSRRGTTTTLGGSERDKQLLAESQERVSALEKKVDELDMQLKTKSEEADSLREEQDARTNAWDSERREWEGMKDEWERARAELEHARAKWDDVKTDLERKLTDAQGANASLRAELDGERRDKEGMEDNLAQQRYLQDELAALRRDKDDMEDDLRRQLQQALEQASQPAPPPALIGDVDGGAWKSRCEELERENQQLREDLHRQREVTEQVRKEASNSLQEMRALSERTQAQWERDEQLTQDFHRMEEEVKIWKNRYAKTKTQLRHLRSSSIGLPGHIQDATLIARENDLSQPDGLVKDVHLTKFQISIDELLRTARSAAPPEVLEQMKGVVLAVRHITQDIEKGQGNGEEISHLRSRAKTRVSATANNLITASKNFANSNGISPVSLLDAAASHLTAAVVELIRTVKIRPTPADELGEDDDEDLGPMQSPAYFSVPPSLGRLSGNDSVYSAISSPHSLRSGSRTNSRLPAHRKTYSNGQLLAANLKPGLGIRELDTELEELRLYLEDQTEGVVQSIQALVSSIRAEDDMSTIGTHIEVISSVVSKVVSATEHAMAQPGSNPALRDRAGPVIQVLSSCRDKLADAGAAGSQATSLSGMREVTSKLPPIAFQIARETKELVQRLDQLEMDNGGEDDDFR
ncbi:component of the polarisome [Onygenales sp. PD_40]|nr:component of the polarisome [Onygenales sp. PD_40]